MNALARWCIQWWLYVCARMVIARHRPLTIAITGSTHTTTVKDSLCEVLRAHHHSIRSHPNSFNTEIGLPLAILYLPSGGRSIPKWIAILCKAFWCAVLERHYPKILIVELGADHPGDIAFLLTIIRPTIAIVTNVTSQYISQFGDLDRTASEFSRLVEIIPSNGMVVLWGDDVRVASLQSNATAPCLVIGSSTNATAKIEQVIETPVDQTWILRVNDRQQQFQTQRRGEHHRFATSAADQIHYWIDHHTL